ncbi:MAG: HD domain-containing phosphohydrolase [Bacilli bacterium]
MSFSRGVLRRSYFGLLSMIGFGSVVFSLYNLNDASQWTEILIVMFLMVSVAFIPLVKLPEMGITLGNLFNIFLIIVVSPWAAVWCMFLGIVVQAVVGRITLLRIAVNTGQLALTILVTGAVWEAMRNTAIPLPIQLIVCSLVYFAVNVVLMSGILSLSNGGPYVPVMRNILKVFSVSYLAMLMIGAITAMLYTAYGVSSVLLVVVLYLFIRFMLQKQLRDANTIQGFADEMHKRYNASIASLAHVIDARDPYTYGHSRRVAEMTRRAVHHMGLDFDDEDVYFGGLLHDVGKVAISDDILLKPGKLDPKEWFKMMQHPVHGEMILKGSGVSDLILQAVRSHHEWIRGGGYPDNLRGNQIPVIARIVGVADAFDAMVSNRPYKKGFSIDETILRLENGRDLQFDRTVVDAFVSLVHSMNVAELNLIGYGDEPPNVQKQPIEVLGDVSPNLKERLEEAAKQPFDPSIYDEAAPGAEDGKDGREHTAEDAKGFDPRFRSDPDGPSLPE